MITLGDYSYNITNDIEAYGGVNVKIGKFCSIAAGLRVEAGYHAVVNYPNLVSQFPFDQTLGFPYPGAESPCRVEIGNDVWVCTMVTILDDVTVGDGAILAAHSVITKDVPPYAFMAGNPATIKKFRFAPEIVEKMMQIKWWNWELSVIKERIADFTDVHTFVEKYAVS